MQRLLASLGGRKWLATLLGMVLVSAMIFTNKDFETVKWFGTWIVGLIATFNIAQGVADGMSKGNTSSSQARW